MSAKVGQRDTPVNLTTFIYSDLDEEKYEAYLSLRDVFPDEKISCQKFRLHFCSIPQLLIQIQSASIHSADNILSSLEVTTFLSTIMIQEEN